MQFKTILLKGFGFLFLGLGAIGLVLPVWPTTPFVLLSVACFSSSPRMKARIMAISFFREHIENYEQGRGLTKKTLSLSLAWLWGMLLLSIICMRTTWITVMLILIGIAVTCHLLYMAKGRKKEEHQ